VSLNWKLGRIIKIRDGADEKVRTVTLKVYAIELKTNEIKHPVVKLCLLPIDYNMRISNANEGTSNNI